jgi:chromosome segregation ATPase
MDVGVKQLENVSGQLEDERNEKIELETRLKEATSFISQLEAELQEEQTRRAQTESEKDTLESKLTLLTSLIEQQHHELEQQKILIEKMPLTKPTTALKRLFEETTQSQEKKQQQLQHILTSPRKKRNVFGGDSSKARALLSSLE